MAEQDSTKEQLHIKSFLDEEYTDFAVYRVYQRLPHILDSLGQTQRKILYMLEKIPENKKLKTAEVYSQVYSGTQYLHGDMSVFNVVENMARSCTNNLNLLTEEGAFGYRSSKAAASPRYTSTRFSPISRKLFRKEDHPIYEEQEFEGKSIEPKYLMPILPPSIINGYSAISVGFASKFLPRHPEEVIDETIKALQSRKKDITKWGKYKIRDIYPTFPFYSGSVIQEITSDNPSSWIFTGAIKKSSTRNIINITDLPPEVTREGFIKKLKRLQDKGIIRSYIEKCVKNNMSFEVKVPPELYKSPEANILDVLNLVERSSENFTFLNPKASADKTVVKFNTVGEYLKVFIEIRQKLYSERKSYQLERLAEEITTLQEKIHFIQEVNDNHIIITKRKKSDLELELEEKGYMKIDGSYDHLLGMRMYALTQENITSFQNSIDRKQGELDMLENTSVEDIHINELRELKKEIKSEIKVKGLV